MEYSDFRNRQLMPQMSSALRALDLFAGCGGLALGFEADGISDDDRKLQNTGVRLLQDERAKVDKAASQQKQKLSQWLRATLIECADKQLKSAG